jgi:hypothetical protein
VLNHCVVTDGLRKFFDDVGEHAVRNEVVSEIAGFIKVYHDSDIEAWYAAQQAKRDLVVAQIQSTLPSIRKHRTQIADEISALMARRADLNAKLDEITLAGTQNLADINRSIQLRSQLAKVEASIITGPSDRALAELDEQIRRLEELIERDAVVPEAAVSQWALQAGELEQSALLGFVMNIIDRDIYASIEQNAQGAPEARAYRLRIVSATLRHFGDLVRHLMNTANYYESQVGFSQHSSNRRLQQLLGNMAYYANMRYLDYDNCLSTLNAAATKLTMQTPG